MGEGGGGQRQADHQRDEHDQPGHAVPPRCRIPGRTLSDRRGVLRPLTFRAAAETYDRHVGRYAPALGSALVEFAGIEPGMRALDVGCGPGALTAQLARRLGAAHVCGAEPSEPFAEACRERVGVEVVPRARRGAPVRGRRVRRGALAAGRELHDRRAGGGGRDGARDAAGWTGRLVRMGLRGRDDVAAGVLGRRAGGGPGARRDRRRGRRHALVRGGRAGRAVAGGGPARRPHGRARGERRLRRLRRPVGAAADRRSHRPGRSASRSTRTARRRCARPTGAGWAWATDRSS